MKTIGIAGDGIVGQLLAFYLHQAGWQITLYSAGKDNNCSMAAAGLLTPIAELEKNDAIIFQLGIEALTTHWPNILNTLAKKIYFKQSGSIVLSHPRDEADLKRFIQIIAGKLSDDQYYEKLNHEKINTLEPDLKHFHHSYYFTLEGQIDNQTLLRELKQYLKEKIKWVEEIVVDIQPGKIIISEGEKYFDYVFDCRGLAAKTSFKNLRGVRGELIWLHAPDVTIQRPIRYLHPRYPLYIVPRPDHVYLIGASELETENEEPISVRTTLELLTAAYSVQPKFSEASVIKTVTHVRPTLPDHLPCIKYENKFIAINGLYRHGFLISPTLVIDVVRYLEAGISAVKYPKLFHEMIL